MVKKNFALPRTSQVVPLVWLDSQQQTGKKQQEEEEEDDDQQQ